MDMSRTSRPGRKLLSPLPNNGSHMTPLTSATNRCTPSDNKGSKSGFRTSTNVNIVP